MKKDTDNDKIVVFFVIVIIALVVISVIYLVFKSNRNLFNNEVSNNATNQNTSENTDQNANSNTNNNTNITDEIDNMNIDKTKIPKIETEIANFTSTLYDKDENRVYNINLAIGKLNGAIIKKGEEFSFNNTIGPMDESHGFKKAVGFDTNGNKIQVAGGGMCQISSTVYNSALIANLEITERHPHSRRVYYVPKDKDATVFYGSLDLKFKNNTDGNIRIDASYDDKSVTIKFIKIT